MFHNVMIDESGGGINDGFADHANLAVSNIEPMGLFPVSCLTVLIPLFVRYTGAQYRGFFILIACDWIRKVISPRR